MQTIHRNSVIHQSREVENRYARAAQQPEAALCCPVDYDPRYLKIIPEEVIAKDYGCGDPSKWLQPGETVLDLGSGTGKIAFIAAQVVGPEGHIIGVDMTDDMLEVARRNTPIVVEKLGYANVSFRKGRIQDLALDLDLLQSELEKKPPAALSDYVFIEEQAEQLRREKPLVSSDSVDVVVSNCVLNLVDAHQKPKLFAEIFRVLKKGGRAVISDIVSDEPVPEHLQNDPELWSGCVSGALTEHEFLRSFQNAGFHGIELVKFETHPWRTVEGIEFRAVTVRAYKGKEGPCYEHNQAVIYQGPFLSVEDDDGHRFPRGERIAVCDKTFRLLQSAPYAGLFSFLEPRETVNPGKAHPFKCADSTLRHPRQSKGLDYNETTQESYRKAPDCC